MEMAWRSTSEKSFRSIFHRFPSEKNLLFGAIKRIASAFLNGASISLLMRPESRNDLSAAKSVSIKKLTNAFLMPGMADKAFLFFRRFARQARAPFAGVLIMVKRARKCGVFVLIGNHLQRYSFSAT